MPSISAQKRHGKVVGYSVYLGSEGGQRRQRRFFVHRYDAEKFVAQQTTTPVPVGELWERKAEILYALERLRPIGTNLADAVAFYLTHQGSPTGQKLWSEVVESFLSEKLRIGRSPQYDRNMRQSLTRFISITGGDRPIGTITRQEIADYVYRTNAKLSPVSKANVLRNLNVLFRYAVKEEWLVKNPVEKITRPIIPFHKPHVLTPADFGKLLHRCLRKRWHDRLVILVLVGFCGIRTEEACRLSWKHLHLEYPADQRRSGALRSQRTGTPIPSPTVVVLRVGKRRSPKKERPRERRFTGSLSFRDTHSSTHGKELVSPRGPQDRTGRHVFPGLFEQEDRRTVVGR